jgi:hypothetical protein
MLFSLGDDATLWIFHLVSPSLLNCAEADHELFTLEVERYVKPLLCCSLLGRGHAGKSCVESGIAEFV